jgi:hypothetical protein
MEASMEKNGPTMLSPAEKKRIIENNRMLASLTPLKRACILVLSPFALCGAIFVTWLAAFCSDRGEAALMAVVMSFVPMFFFLVVVFFRSPMLDVNSRLDALFGACSAAVYGGLTALILGYGWTVIEALHARNGHFILGGAFVMSFSTAVLAAFTTLGSQFCVRPARLFGLMAATASCLAVVGSVGSIALASLLAAASVIILAVIILRIPRSVPPEVKPLF